MAKNRDQHIALSFFQQHPLMTLTTLTEGNIPQNAMVYVYIDENMQCFFATRSTTRKFDNLLTNNLTTLSTFDENVLMFGELRGEAKLLEDVEEIGALLPELQKILESRKSSYWVPPVAQLEGNDYVFFKITPKEVTLANYELSSAENPRPTFIHFELNEQYLLLV